MRLVAYVVPAGAHTGGLTDGLEQEDDAGAVGGGVQVLPLEGLVDLKAVRGILKQTLPEHMVPSGFVGLARLPLTPSGKVDRKALPETDVSTAQAAYVAPRTETETLICQVMREVIAHDRLDLERVGIDDHFFDIGGHSIFAAQLAMRLEQALGLAVPVRLIFEAPTARELSIRLAKAETGTALPPVVPVDRSVPIPASFEQERMWLLNAI